LIDEHVYIVVNLSWLVFMSDANYVFFGRPVFELTCNL